MTAAQITGGVVEFTRPSNYSTDKSGAKVTLSFVCPEGTVHDDAVAMLDAVAALAVRKALELTGDKPVPFAPTTAAPAPAPVAPSVPSRDVHAPTQQALVGAAPSAAVNATTSPAASTPPALVGNTASGDAASPLVLVGDTHPSPAPDPTLIGAPAATGPASPALVSTAPAEITDADLVNAITAANARMFGRAATDEEKQLVPRALTAALLAYLPPTFNGPPKVQMIPADKRPSALAAFNAL